MPVHGTSYGEWNRGDMIDPVTTPPTTTLPAPAPEAKPSAAFMKRMAEGTGNPLTQTTTTSAQVASTTVDAKPTATTPPTTTEATTKPAASVPEGKPARKGKDKPVRVARGYEHLPIKPPKPALTKEDVKDIAREVGSETGKAVAAELAKAAPEAADDLGLNEQEEYELQVLSVMEKQHPEKYKGVVDNAKRFMSEFEAFAADWEEKHPGETFNPEGQEAVKFCQDNQPRWSAVDFERAKVRLEVEPIEEENKKLRQELDSSRQTATEAQVNADALREAVTRGDEVAKKFSPEMAKIIKPDGSFDQVLVNKLLEEGDETTPILIDAVQQVENISATAVQLFSGRPLETFKGEEAAYRDRVIAVCQHLDREFMALPPEQQLDQDGRQFAPLPVYAKMTPKEKAKHWALTADVVTTLAAEDIARGAKARAEAETKRIEGIAARRGYVKTVANDNGAPAKPAAQKAAPSKKPETVEASSGKAPDEGAQIKTGPAPGSFLSRFKTGVAAPRLR